MKFELNNGLREKQSVKTGCSSVFKEGVPPFDGSACNPDYAEVVEANMFFEME